LVFFQDTASELKIQFKRLQCTIPRKQDRYASQRKRKKEKKKKRKKSQSNPLPSAVWRYGGATHPCLSVTELWDARLFVPTAPARWPLPPLYPLLSLLPPPPLSKLLLPPPLLPLQSPLPLPLSPPPLVLLSSSLPLFLPSSLPVPLPAPLPAPLPTPLLAHSALIGAAGISGDILLARGLVVLVLCSKKIL
jgi:hypothetical protein